MIRTRTVPKMYTGENMKRGICIFVIFILSCFIVCFAQEEAVIQYSVVKAKRASCSIGILYRRTPNGVVVEIAVLATGKGTDFRKWGILDTKLNIDGQVVKPVETEKFYSKKESIFRAPATVVFAAIGTQYERYASSCTQGEVCPVTGQAATQQVSQKTGPVAGAIDKAGMAAGMGLLTSQAKGEITGMKSTFMLNNDLASRVNGERDLVKIVLENREARQKIRVETHLPSIVKQEDKSTAKLLEDHLSGTKEKEKPTNIGTSSGPRPGGIIPPKTTGKPEGPAGSTGEPGAGSADEKKPKAEKDEPGKRPEIETGYEHLRYPFAVFRKLSAQMKRKVFKHFSEEIDRMRKSGEAPDPDEAMRRAIRRANAESNPDDWGEGEQIL